MKVHDSLLIILSLVLSAQGIPFSRKVRKLFGDNSVCILNVKKDFSRADTPVLLHPESNEPYLPEPKGRTKSVIILKKKQGIKVVCPGADNVIGDTGMQSAIFNCTGGTDLTMVMGGETQDSKDIFCWEPVKYETKPNAGDCADGEGVLTEIGFEAEGEFKMMYSACYSTKTKETFFTRHDLMGTIVKGRATHLEFSYRDFDVGEIAIPTANVIKMFDAYHPDETFGSVAQRGGGHQLANIFNQKSWRLIPMQLSPVDDFVMAYEQRSTYFFVNTAPVWSSVRNGNLFALERKLRRLARERGLVLHVITGVSGTQSLNHRKNDRDKKPLYLDIIETENPRTSTQIPVPKHIYKIVEADHSCMMFIIRNEPHITSNPKLACPNECRTYHWRFNNQLSRGYVSCCAREYYGTPKVTNFKFPDDLKCTRTLDGKLKKRRS